MRTAHQTSCKAAALLQEAVNIKVLTSLVTNPMIRLRKVREKKLSLLTESLEAKAGFLATSDGERMRAMILIHLSLRLISSVSRWIRKLRIAYIP